MKKTTKNKTMQKAIHNHAMSDTYTLRHAYANFSYNKEKAFNYCVDLCEKYNGYNLKIIGFNTCTFSVGFYFTDENGKQNFAYITKSYDRFCEM